MTRKLGFTARDLCFAIFATLVVTLLLMQANVNSKTLASVCWPTPPHPTLQYRTYLPFVSYWDFDSRPTPTPIPTPRPTPYWR